MPCHSAMIDKPLSVSADTPVEDVLAQMKKQKTEFAAVVDKKGILLGLFSHRILIKNLLPVAVPLGGGLSLDINIKAAPGIAKRLRKVLPLPVQDIMERKINLVRPETPTWEGVSLLAQHGPPLLVVKDEGMKFLGIITPASAVADLQKLEG